MEGSDARELRQLSIDELVNSFPNPPSAAPSGRPPPSLILKIRNLPLPSTSPRPYAPRPYSTETTPRSPQSQEPINFQLLLKGCRGDLSPTDQTTLHAQLLGASPTTLSSTLDRAYKEWESSRSSGGGSAPPTPLSPTPKTRISALINKSKDALGGGKGDGRPCTIGLSKCSLDFGEGIKMGKPLSEEIMISATNGRPTFSFRALPPTSTHSLVVTPPTFSFKKEQQTVNVSVTLTMRSTFKLGIVLTIDVEDGGHYFLLVKGVSEKSVFGAPLNEIDCTDDGGLRVPSVLVVMKRCLYEGQALNQEGIFRLQGNEDDMNKIKEQLNRGVFSSCRDMNAVACLIKQWFRDMPQSVLSDIPQEVLLNMGADPTEEDVEVALSHIKEPNKSLFNWLIALLADVASLESINRMTTRNLAIVIAPNLFGMNNQNTVDAVMLSQKIVAFVHKLLTMRMKQRYDYS